MLTVDTRLAAHFTAGELTRDGQNLGAFLAAVSPLIEANLLRTASGLESIRQVLGVPLRITSGFRPGAYNAAVGGVPTSSHLDGLAADFVPLGISQYAAYTALQTAALPAWDQIIYYPIQGHMHVGFGPLMRREVRIHLSADPGGTPILSESLVERLTGYAASSVDFIKSGYNWLWLIALALGAYFLFRRWPKGA